MIELKVHEKAIHGHVSPRHVSPRYLTGSIGSCHDACKLKYMNEIDMETRPHVVRNHFVRTLTTRSVNAENVQKHSLLAKCVGEKSKTGKVHSLVAKDMSRCQVRSHDTKKSGKWSSQDRLPRNSSQKVEEFNITRCKVKKGVDTSKPREKPRASKSKEGVEPKGNKKGEDLAPCEDKWSIVRTDKFDFGDGSPDKLKVRRLDDQNIEVDFEVARHKDEEIDKEKLIEKEGKDEIIVPRHQEASGEKNDKQSNVNKENASVLSKIRANKVKDLVGAFEALISFGDHNNLHAARA